MKKLWWVILAVVVTGVGMELFRQPQPTALPSFAPGPVQTMAATEPSPPEPTVQQVGTQEPQTQLPYHLQYTSLHVQELISYDGPDLEHGAQEDLFGVAALVLQNTGTIGIEYAQVELTQDGNKLYFDATYIPPRAAVLILEENGTPYSDSPVTQCRCRTVIPGDFDWSKDAISVSESGLGSLQVTNLTDRSIGCVRVFYKHHYGEDDLYVGGITYSAVIPDLAPGETRTITPYRYAAGYTKIVAIAAE